ncbi:DUF3822 family protein [Flavobacteriaceae bacterium AU392]|nr:DUF3822 family protein [Flavobacteriaceae bacterium]RKM85726.1 DUF3822 family protein [Flavobacteriaceae bacterium AU392]
METGQKIIQASNNISKFANHKLSIQVSLSGLSFCILNWSSSTFIYYKSVRFDKKRTPSQVLDKLIHCFNNEELLQQQFKNVIVIHNNELSTFVPKPLFSKEHLADYLKFNSKILKTDFIAYDEILINDSINIYVPYVNINNYLYDKFGEFEFKHTSSILLESILNLEKNSTSHKVIINVSETHFELFALNKHQLLLYNIFEFHTKEDFIYYILFTLEQLELNPEEVKVILSGNIFENDELYSVVYNYIRHIDFLNSTTPHKLAEGVSSSLLNNLTLINSF